MQTIRGARILLALKTSLAVALSWVVAQRMPGVIDDYPYYAPLGAISAMYPTVLGSVRAGLQTVAGIALGIMLAAGVLLVGDPNLVTVSVAVGVGVLLAGIRRLGAGAEYVPVGALFVLIVGGQDAEGFSQHRVLLRRERALERRCGERLEQRQPRDRVAAAEWVESGATAGGETDRLDAECVRQRAVLTLGITDPCLATEHRLAEAVALHK